MNNPDLGNLEIFEKPLIIHEAKVGGRRLTKTLFRQLPDWGLTYASLILSDCSAAIVAWVNYHWKECALKHGRYANKAYGEHKHILLNENGKPYRGTVWKEPQPNNAININFWEETDASYAAAALLSRLKMKESDLKSEYGTWIFPAYHKEREIRFHCDAELGAALNGDISNKSYFGSAHRERLIKTSQIQEEREVLIASIDEYIATVDSFRSDVKQTWDLVTLETPQIFL